MTKTIWIDFKRKAVFQTKDELQAEYLREVIPESFPNWLHDNYSACDVWDWDENDRKEIEAEFKDIQQERFEDWVLTTFKAVEVRM